MAQSDGTPPAWSVLIRRTLHPERSADLTATDLRVLNAFLAHLNGDGTCRPGLRLIASILGVTERTVKRTLRKVSEWNVPLLIRERRGFGSGSATSVNMSEAAITEAEEAAPSALDPGHYSSPTSGESSEDSHSDHPCADPNRDSQSGHSGMSPMKGDHSGHAGMSPHSGHSGMSPQNSVLNSQSKNPPTPQAGRRAWVRLFPEFWVLYPRKVSKQAARKAWEKIAPPDPGMARSRFDQVKALLALRLSEWSEADRPKDRLPYPATWLNAESFDHGDVQEAILASGQRVGECFACGQPVEGADRFCELCKHNPRVREQIEQEARP